MRGIILAGGTGSRLWPLTRVSNKHLLPIYQMPMIYYPLYSLIEAGIKDILIISGPNHLGSIMELLGSGTEFGCNLTYKVQDTPGGLPHAINVAKDFVGNDKFVSFNGDNIVIESLKPFVQAFEKGKELSRIVIVETTREEASKAGVVVFEGDNVIKVVEKPKDPPTNWVAIGVYMYSPDVFEVIKTLKPSARGELEITDLHNHYIRQDSLKASKLLTEWTDAGSFDELVKANLFMQNHSAKSIFSKMPEHLLKKNNGRV